MIGRPQSLSDSNWDSLLIKTNFGHHTVSSYSPSRLTPVLSLVKNGRSDLPGPLCNGYGGWDLCARLICFGYANHPGAGGPFTVGGYTIPKDSARRYAFGWEFEGGINAGDWSRLLTNPRTGDQMTFHEFMARCGAGTQDYFNLVNDAHLEHSTWTDRKIDRLGYTRSTGIQLINKYRGTTNPEDEMTPAQMTELKNWIEARTQAYAEHNDLHVDQVLNAAKADLKAHVNEALAADNDLATQIADVFTPETGDTAAATTLITHTASRAASQVIQQLQPQLASIQSEQAAIRAALEALVPKP